MAFYETGWFKYFKNLWIGLGAGFIIIGALFKIMHWPYANEVLTAAMIAEASIFFLQAILPPHKEYYWEKLYPGLDNVNAPMEAITVGPSSGSGATQRLDEALSKANVTQDLISRLGTHLNTLGDNLAQLTQVTGTTSATNEFSKQAEAAAKALANVKTAYDGAANVAHNLMSATEDTEKYHQQVKKVSENLAALNAVYELELQDTNNHLKALNKFYTNLTGAIDNLNDSVEDTKKYKDQMGTLARNLSSLNNVYGNMLTAMSVGAKSGK